MPRASERASAAEAAAGQPATGTPAEPTPPAPPAAEPDAAEPEAAPEAELKPWERRHPQEGASYVPPPGVSLEPPGR
jgi:hypothetical protein